MSNAFRMSQLMIKAFTSALWEPPIPLLPLWQGKMKALCRLVRQNICALKFIHKSLGSQSEAVGGAHVIANESRVGVQYLNNQHP